MAALVCGAPAAAMDRLVFEAPGAAENLTKALKAASLLQEAANAEETPGPQELLAAARADYGRLVGALYQAGHYSGVVRISIDGREAASIPPVAPPSRVGTVRVSVQPGPAFAFGRARIAPLAAGTELPEGFALGKPAKADRIQGATAAAVDGWRDSGHAKAVPSGQRIVADHAQARLDADITIAPGPRVTFGKLIITGNQRTRTERVHEIAGFPSGTQFSPEALETSTKRLRRTGAFQAVSLTEAEDLGPGDTMDVTATLAEAKRRRLGFGAEIETTSGGTLTAYWLHRNLTGNADRLRFDTEITGIGGETGGIDFWIEGRWSRPATFNPDNTLFIEGSLGQLDEEDYTLRWVEIGAGLTRIVNDRFTVEYGLSYRFAEAEVGGVTTEFQQINLPLSATYDTRDSELDATEGYYLDLEVMPFAGLSGTESSARIYGDGRTYLGFGAEKNVVLAGRVQLGSVFSDTLRGVAQDYRFYSGGGGTVRGQSYQSLGVDLGGGTRTAGRSFAGLSLEVRGKVRGPIGLVGFVDYGYVGPESFPDGSGDSHAGAGLGLRYDTGIGPIRLDVAAPIAGGGSGAQVYLGIGQAF